MGGQKPVSTHNDAVDFAWIEEKGRVEEGLSYHVMGVRGVSKALVGRGYHFVSRGYNLPFSCRPLSSSGFPFLQRFNISVVNLVMPFLPKGEFGLMKMQLHTMVAVVHLRNGY